MSKSFIASTVILSLFLFTGLNCDDDSSTTELEGTWIDTCHLYDSGVTPNAYRVHTFIFTGNEYELIEHAYADPTCQTIYTDTTASSGDDSQYAADPFNTTSGTFTIGGAGAVADSKKLDYTSSGGDAKTIYKINADGTLQLGDDVGAVDGDGYFITLDELIYTKQ